MPTVLDSAAAISALRTTSAKCTDPISSSPSPTSTRLTGGLRPAPRSAWSAARKVASGPFWFTAPRPTITLPKPGLSTSRASHGGEAREHQGGGPREGAAQHGASGEGGHAPPSPSPESPVKCDRDSSLL